LPAAGRGAGLRGGEPGRWRRERGGTRRGCKRGELRRKAAPLRGTCGGCDVRPAQARGCGTARRGAAWRGLGNMPAAARAMARRNVTIAPDIVAPTVVRRSALHARSGRVRAWRTVGLERPRREKKRAASARCVRRRISRVGGICRTISHCFHRARVGQTPDGHRLYSRPHQPPQQVRLATLAGPPRLRRSPAPALPCRPTATTTLLMQHRAQDLEYDLRCV